MILEAEHISIGYGSHLIAKDINLSVEKSDIISIIGPNGSGKSTMLKALARLLPVTSGRIHLAGNDIQTMDEKAVAKLLAFMPQSADFPGDLTVRELVSMGRMPYRGFFDEFSELDSQAVNRALELTNMVKYQYRSILALSGGERQRARLALALAQEPQVLLLDEPTTYLDIRHQLELMVLVNRLHDELGLTVVMVLHDLNHAARFSNRIVAVKDGQIVADGCVDEVFTEENIRLLYGVENTILTLNEAGEDHLVCLPHGLEKVAKAYYVH
ncbi:MAG: ABC transporter ATP-binding protein [Anaerovibrio sp.]|uniref:ABC transporter ATP-binding protein n=1 Tax=Anaerovibrio sp. TaxID=1872532 RepID=UPI0025BAF5F6|nr:ABC transporter ATP-binding protein [Anaerovibrio sp.]MBE6098510.1 ABC transporter ATP-binding protein [Anaerovibrio sp.]